MWSYQRLLSRPRVQRSAISFVLLICRLYVTPPHTSPVHAKTVDIKKNLNTGIEKQQQKNMSNKKINHYFKSVFYFSGETFSMPTLTSVPIGRGKKSFYFQCQIVFFEAKSSKSLCRALSSET